MQNDVGNQLGCHGVPPLHLMVRNASSSCTKLLCQGRGNKTKLSIIVRYCAMLWPSVRSVAAWVTGT